MANESIRGGAKLRKQVKKVRIMKRAKYTCPVCGKKQVARVSNAIFKCKSCSSTFTGGSYSLSTPIGEISKRTIEQNKKNRKKQ